MNPAPRSAPQAAHRLADKWPVVRFVITFGALAVAFNLFYHGWLAETDAIRSYLQALAQMVGWIIHRFGSTVVVDGVTLAGDGFSLDIGLGCDASQPMSLFAFAVLAAPVAWRQRWIGLAVGLPALFAVNLIRIVSLFYIRRVCSLRWFEWVHMDLWQAAFIVLALAMWVAWVLRARRLSAIPNGAS